MEDLVSGLFLMNSALLAKVAWRILSNLSSLLAQVLKVKHEKNRGCWQANSQSDSSLVWRTTKEGISILQDNVCWSIGYGSKVRIGLDPWLPSAPDYIPKINPRFAHLVEYKVSSLVSLSGGWNRPLILEAFTPSNAISIFSLPPPSINLCGVLLRGIFLLNLAITFLPRVIPLPHLTGNHGGR